MVHLRLLEDVVAMHLCPCDTSFAAAVKQLELEGRLVQAFPIVADMEDKHEMYSVVSYR